MKYLPTVILGLLILLSLLAGAAKILVMPQEVQFFAAAGIGSIWLMPLGILQAVGSVLAISPRSRGIGSACMFLGFLISAVIIYMTGNAPFALFSLLPALLCGFVIWQSRRSHGTVT